MFRAVVAATFLLVSAGAIWMAFFVFGTDSGLGTLFINMGTEIFGILITVAVVEWFFERRRLRDRGREIAWSVLHSLQRAVWVWQGGPGQPATDELLGLISAITTEDPMPPFTQTLLVNIGSQCRQAMDKEAKALRTVPRLTESLEELTSLRSLRESRSHVGLGMVTEVLASATTDLAEVLGQPAQKIPAALIRYRDTSISAQEERFYEGAAVAPRPQPDRGVSPPAGGAPQPA